MRLGHARADFAVPMKGARTSMVDNFAIALTHGLMALALWRLLHRDDLDAEVSPRMQFQARRDAERDQRGNA